MTSITERPAHRSVGREHCDEGLHFVPRWRVQKHRCRSEQRGQFSRNRRPVGARAQLCTSRDRAANGGGQGDGPEPRLGACCALREGVGVVMSEYRALRGKAGCDETGQRDLSCAPDLRAPREVGEMSKAKCGRREGIRRQCGGHVGKMAGTGDRGQGKGRGLRLWLGPLSWLRAPVRFVALSEAKGPHLRFLSPDSCLLSPVTFPKCPIR